MVFNHMYAILTFFPVVCILYYADVRGIARSAQ